jgi:serine/threonine protein phosphatase 1
MLYAIGDIHGRFDLLQKLYNEILDDIKKVDDPFGAQIIFLGDYIDRGPESKQVLDFLMDLSDYDHPNVKHIILIGNHELMMLDSWMGIYDGNFSMWTHNGGVQTLKSFGLPKEPIRDNPIIEPYAKWIALLPTYAMTDDYIFCHSGYFDPNIPLDDQYNSLLWGRPSKGRYIGFHKRVIHGHTPQDGKPLIDVNRINVDIGCGHPGYNSLCAVVLPHHGCTDADIRFIQT